MAELMHPPSQARDALLHVLVLDSTPGSSRGRSEDGNLSLAPFTLRVGCENPRIGGDRRHREVLGDDEPSDIHQLSVVHVRRFELAHVPSTPPLSREGLDRRPAIVIIHDARDDTDPQAAAVAVIEVPSLVDADPHELDHRARLITRALHLHQVD
ncbi:MAG TPA: hypothetical protein VMA77_04110 [Solirubrobacteraceae bacterium]|nr:hypothetical protein [Solirubrobacteraceae bacterium]